MANDEPIHEAAAHQAHTYHFVWENVPAGTYRLTATATDEQGLSFSSAGVWLTVGEEEPVQKGISAGKGKYLGNIISFRGPERDYLKYWNGLTAENGEFDLGTTGWSLQNNNGASSVMEVVGGAVHPPTGDNN